MTQRIAKPARNSRYNSIELRVSTSEREEFESTLRQIYRQAPYQDFAQLGLTLPEFQDIRSVAALIDILGLDRVEVESKMHTKPGWVEEVKAHPLYEQVRDRVRDEYLKSCDSTTFDQIAVSAQGAVARGILELAETGPARERIQALAELASRVSAKKSRNDENDGQQDNGPTPPANLLSGLQAAFAMFAAMGQPQQIAAGGVFVDASKLNVPAEPKKIGAAPE